MENNKNTDIIWFLGWFPQKREAEEVMAPVLLNHDLLLTANFSNFISGTKSRKHRMSKNEEKDFSVEDDNKKLR